MATVSLAIPMAILGAPAAFAETQGWAGWDPLAGSGGDYTTTVQLPANGFPAATMQSDSRSNASVVSGASTWLSAETAPGAKYGSSRGQQYVNLRPQADQASAPSTTTYTFDQPTPANGWAFVLGDIDSDAVTVNATGADGQALSTEELGFQGVFNYCDAAGSPSCTGGDLPTWDPGTRTLTGNPAAADTDGAASWFEPSVPVSTLTLTFQWRQGFPIYQTWFAATARDIAGTVTVPSDDETPLADVTVSLTGPGGEELATTVTDAEGNYSFPGYATSDGYRVEVTPPAGYAMDGAAGPAGEQVREADLSSADDLDVDFALIVPEAPVAVDDESLGNAPGEAVTVPVLENDSDGLDPATVNVTGPGGDPVKELVVPGEGAWTVDGEGRIVFTPDEGFSGDPTPIDYTVEDSIGQRTGASVTITYSEAVPAPVAVDDESLGNAPGEAVTVPVLENDSDGLDPATVNVTGPGGDPVKELVVPGEGAWTVDDDGLVTFTPADGLDGDPSSVDYTVEDREGRQVGARITVTYEPTGGADPTEPPGGVDPTEPPGVDPTEPPTQPGDGGDLTGPPAGGAEPSGPPTGGAVPGGPSSGPADSSGGGSGAPGTLPATGTGVGIPTALGAALLVLLGAVLMRWSRR